MSASNYIIITEAATATATRDLSDMVAKGAVRRTGERRHVRYRVNLPVRPAMIDGYDRFVAHSG